MGKRKFRLFPDIPATNHTELVYKEYYQSWRLHNRNSKAGFIQLFNSFKEAHLKDIEPGALKLYLFFYFAATNEYGDSWHSIQSIADFFGKQTRTVNDWIKVLVERDLIYREQTDKKSYTTFLIPYTNTLIAHKPSRQRDTDQEIIDDIIDMIKKREHVYGEIIDVIHLFQWKNDQKQKYANEQVIIVITQRNNGILIGHWYRLKRSGDFCINEYKIWQNCFFESSFRYKDLNITGFALPYGKISLSRIDDFDEVLGLVEQYVKGEEWLIKELPFVDYGNKEEVLIEDEIEEQAETEAEENGEQDKNEGE